jgi:hypothetical protein
MVLPGSSRLIQASLPIGNERFARPGIYRLELQYKADNARTFTVVNRRFFYVNIDIFLPVVALIIVTIYIGRYLTSREVVLKRIRKRSMKRKERRNKKTAQATTGKTSHHSSPAPEVAKAALPQRSHKKTTDVSARKKTSKSKRASPHKPTKHIPIQ